MEIKNPVEQNNEKLKTKKTGFRVLISQKLWHFINGGYKLTETHDMQQIKELGNLVNEARAIYHNVKMWHMKEHKNMNLKNKYNSTKIVFQMENPNKPIIRQVVCVYYKGIENGCLSRIILTDNVIPFLKPGKLFGTTMEELKENVEVLKGYPIDFDNKELKERFKGDDKNEEK